jgi:DNA-binding SARP family transcriptional activator
MHRAVKGLLAYLVLFRRVHAREVLLDLFWGEYREDRARKCLNTALWRLRKVLEPAGVPRGTYLMTTSMGKVGFNRQSDCCLDVAEFEKHTPKALDRPYNALTCGQKILGLDPLREEIHREMKRLHAANRQRTLSIRQYDTCCRILDEDLSVGPMEETRLLHDQICSQKKYDLNSPDLRIRSGTARQTLHQARKALREFERISEHLQGLTRRLEQFIG